MISQYKSETLCSGAGALTLVLCPSGERLDRSPLQRFNREIVASFDTYGLHSQ